MGRCARCQRQPFSAARPAGARPQPSGDGGAARCLHPLQSVRARLPRGPGQRRDRHGRARPRRKDRVRFRRSDGPLDLRRLRRMRPGLPDRRADAGEPGRPERHVYQRARPAGRERLPVLRSRLPADLPDQGRSYRRGRGQGRTGQPQPAVRQGPLRLRLCAPRGPADRTADPQGRGRQGRCRDRSGQPADPFPRRDLGRGARARRPRSGTHSRPGRTLCAGRVRLGQGLERRGLPVPEAGAHRFRQQQCRPLHPAVPRLVGRRPDGGDRLRRGNGAAHPRPPGGGRLTAPSPAAADAVVIIIIGARPTENHPVAATFFKQATKRGAKLFVMDPRGQLMARHATKMLKFKPGRDVALLNALLHTIVEEGLHDRQYVQAHTDDFEKLREHVRDYAPEKMAEICGIDAATLREVARTYARAKSAIIFWGMGISQHVHGTDNARCLIALALVTGQVGRPGTGLHPLRGQNNVQGASDVALIPMFYPDYQSVEDANIRAKFEGLWQTSLDPKRGLTVVEIMDAVHAGQIKGMYIMGENPAMSDPDVEHARAALAHLEHLVVQDLFLTETAKYADVVLPASAWPEKDGTVTNTNRQVQMGRTALPMPGNARQDWWIIQELARRIGLDWSYTHPRDVFAEMKLAMPSLNGITWERLQRESSVTYPCDSETEPGHDIVFGEGFPTKSGRGRFVPAAIVPPAEEPDADFPMVLTTGRQLEHWHTGAMTRRASVLDELEPEAVASLAPAELRRLGIGPAPRLRAPNARRPT